MQQVVKAVDEQGQQGSEEHLGVVRCACIGKVYERMEECGRSLPSEVIDLLATAISVNTGYTSRIVVSSLTYRVRQKSGATDS